MFILTFIGKGLQESKQTIDKREYTDSGSPEHSTQTAGVISHCVPAYSYNPFLSSV